MQTPQQQAQQQAQQSINEYKAKVLDRMVRLEDEKDQAVNEAQSLHGVLAQIAEIVMPDSVGKQVSLDSIVALIKEKFEPKPAPKPKTKRRARNETGE